MCIRDSIYRILVGLCFFEFSSSIYTSVQNNILIKIVSILQIKVSFVGYRYRAINPRNERSLSLIFSSSVIICRICGMGEDLPQFLFRFEFLGEHELNRHDHRKVLCSYIRLCIMNIGHVIRYIIDGCLESYAGSKTDL